MARPIKETPVLTGKDAELFQKNIEKVGRASQKEIEMAENAYNKFKLISTFPL